MRIWKILLVGVVAAAGLSSCDGKGAGKKKIKIAVIPKGTTHIFWQSVHAGAEKAGKEFGVDIEWIGPVREDEYSEQIGIVDNMVTRRVSGIVLAPQHASALRRPVIDAVKKTVPVVIIDSGLDDAEDIYTSFAATDNRGGGRIAGQKMGEILGGKGKVAVLRYSEGSASTHNREEGFLEAIAKFPGVEVVDKDMYAGVTRGEALAKSQSLLTRHKKAGKLMIDGIFCPNASSAYGMLQAIKLDRDVRDLAIAGKLTYIGFDADDPLVAGLGSGEIKGLVIQNPFKMGYKGVEAMVRHLRGEKVVKQIDTGVGFVTKDNLTDPEIQEMINPDLGKWLK